MAVGAHQCNEIKSWEIISEMIRIWSHICVRV